MAMNKAHCVGAAQVIDWYDRNAKYPYYSVWSGKQLNFSWNDDDENQGRDKLLEDLTAFEQNSVSDVMTIRLHPKADPSGVISTSSAYYASLNFRPCPYSMDPVYKGAVTGTMGLTDNVYQLLKQTAETNKAILDRLTAMDMEEEQEPELDNSIIGLIKQPQIQQALIGFLGNMLTKNRQPMNQDQQRPAAMAGTVTQHDIQILQSLLNKGVTTDHLVKLDQMDQAKLTMLLNML